MEKPITVVTKNGVSVTYTPHPLFDDSRICFSDRAFSILDLSKYTSGNDPIPYNEQDKLADSENYMRDYKELKESFWERIIGIKPDAEFTPKMAESKCYKCESKNVKSMDASCWTGKLKCNDCGCFTYIIHADFMGGALNEDVAISKQDCKI